MAFRPQIEDEFPGVPWPELTAIGCEECTAGFDDFFSQCLAGLPPNQKAIPAHLESCPACSRIYLDLFDLLTATQVKQLMDSWIEPEQAPSGQTIAGMLTLVQLCLGTAELVEDPKASNRGLSLLGLGRRQLQDEQEARLVHELSLRTADETGDLVSKVISHTDLGYMALSGHRTDEALDFLQNACHYAVELTDKESETRVHIVLGQAWEQAGNLERAQGEYKLAIESAIDPSYSLGRDVASKQLATIVSDTMSMIGQVFGTLSSALGEESPQVQALRQLVGDIAGFGSSRLEQLTRFYDGFLQPSFGFAAGGERILVVNTAEEIGMQIVAGPRVDRNGHFLLTIAIAQDALANLPEEFSIDLLFLPTNDVLRTFRVTAEERLRLQTVRGLELSAELPSFEGFRETLTNILDRENREYQDFPRAAFSLRAWW